MSNSSIWPIDRTLSGASTLDQSGPGSDGNEGVLLLPQISSITGASPSDCLASYQDTSLWSGVLTLLKRCSWCILQPQPTGLMEIRKVFLPRLVTKAISKYKSPKLGKTQKVKMLNGHKIRMINSIKLQFSGFIFHVETNKWWNFEKKIGGSLGWTLHTHTHTHPNKYFTLGIVWIQLLLFLI